MPVREVRKLNNVKINNWLTETPFEDRVKVGSGYPFSLDDSRVIRFNEKFPLENKTILELGSLEGALTVGMLMRGAIVTPLDIHEENCRLSKLRCLIYGYEVSPICMNAAEIRSLDTHKYDAVFHSGLLYHMMYPVLSLKACYDITNTIYLATHYSLHGKQIYFPETELAYHRHDGISFHCKDVGDSGGKDRISGSSEKSCWLTRASIMKALHYAGFTNKKVILDDVKLNHIEILATKE